MDVVSCLQFIYSKLVNIFLLFINSVYKFILPESTNLVESYIVTGPKIIQCGNDFLQNLMVENVVNKEKCESVTRIIDHVIKLQPIVEDVSKKAPEYDFDNPANGLRTFITITERVAAVACEMMEKKEKDVWKLQQIAGYFEILFNLFGQLKKLLDEIEPGELLANHELDFFEIRKWWYTGSHHPCFGDYLGIQFDSGLAWKLKWIYGLFSLELNSEKRAKRIVSLLLHADVNGIRRLWDQSNSIFLYYLCKMARPIEFSSEVSFNIPGSEKKLKGQLISSVLRKGEMGGREPLSPFIVLHLHGGGFISQTAKSQEVYLRDWAQILKVPIYSLEYSKAPENKYPKAMFEVISAYEYIVENSARFGSTGQKIILAGDSAGANLILGATMILIERNRRLPDGLFLANVPVCIKLTLSPSRLLTSIDPLLPYGCLLRCIKAYAGEDVQSKNEEETSDCLLCNDPSDPVHNEFPRDITGNFQVPNIPYINPIYASDEVLKQMPPIKLASTSTDPCLDEMIAFAKKLRHLGNEVSLDVLKDLPHGFLNFALVHHPARAGSHTYAKIIGSLLKE